MPSINLPTSVKPPPLPKFKVVSMGSKVTAHTNEARFEKTIVNDIGLNSSPEIP
ncbi:MAG: hypothetical protein ACD_79C00921G0001 [uncultured bacterium]|nr:MAG: hypothetical protein ACD_79C00921G0001 [uncultured bacterium]